MEEQLCCNPYNLQKKELAWFHWMIIVYSHESQKIKGALFSCFYVCQSKQIRWIIDSLWINDAPLKWQMIITVKLSYSLFPKCSSQIPPPCLTYIALYPADLLPYNNQTHFFLTSINSTPSHGYPKKPSPNNETLNNSLFFSALTSRIYIICTMN